MILILSGREHHLGRFCIGNLQAGDSMVGNLIRVGLGCVWQVWLVGKKRKNHLFSRSADAQVKRTRKWF
ncbi:hypothetical protein EDC32_1011182 [Laceyella sacchari]|nr:hypothetical protein EDC32_1011182 [Laceyella sacchari]